MVLSGSSGFLHQLSWQPRYNLTIVDSGILSTIKQTNKQAKETFVYRLFLMCIVLINITNINIDFEIKMDAVELAHFNGYLFK